MKRFLPALQLREIEAVDRRLILPRFCLFALELFLDPSLVTRSLHVPPLWVLPSSLSLTGPRHQHGDVTRLTENGNRISWSSHGSHGVDVDRIGGMYIFRLHLLQSPLITLPNMSGVFFLCTGLEFDRSYYEWVLNGKLQP